MIKRTDKRNKLPVEIVHTTLESTGTLKESASMPSRTQLGQFPFVINFLKEESLNLEPLKSSHQEASAEQSPVFPHKLNPLKSLVCQQVAKHSKHITSDMTFFLTSATNRKTITFSQMNAWFYSLCYLLFLNVCVLRLLLHHRFATSKTQPVCVWQQATKQSECMTTNQADLDFFFLSQQTSY